MTVGLLLLALLSAAPAQAPEPVAGLVVLSLRETRPDGTYVDWLEGRVGARGKILVYRDLKNRVFFEQAKKSAEIDGQDKILATLKGLRIDGSSKLSDRPELLEAVEENLRRVESSNYRAGPGPMFFAEVSFPLFGINGASGAVLPRGVERAEARAAPASADGTTGEDDRPVTGLVVDASHLPDGERPVPVLATRIVDAGGRLVYGLERADPDIARDNGLAAYGVGIPRGESSSAAIARTGSNPMRIDAVGAGGPGNADVIISIEDADRVLAAAATAPFLEGCQVLILLVQPPPPQWQGTGSRLHQPPKKETRQDKLKIPE